MSNDAVEYRVYTITTVKGYPKEIPLINCEIILSSDTPTYLMEAIINQGSYQECVFCKKILHEL